MHLYSCIGLPTPRVQFFYRHSIPPQPLRLPAPYTPPHPVYATQVVERPPIAHLRPRAPIVPIQQPRQLRHFTPLGMPLGEVLQTLMIVGLLSPLAPRPLPQVVHPHFRWTYIVLIIRALDILQINALL